MPEIPESFVHYLAAWNEPDLEKVAGHLALAVSDEVLFVDPANTARGPDGIERLIREAREGMPTAEYRQVTGIDGHNQRYRYRWEVWVDGQLLAPGMDAVTVDEDGRLLRIDGFFGDFPPLA